MQKISLDIIYSDIFQTIPVLKKCYKLYQHLNKKQEIKLFRAYNYKIYENTAIIYPIGVYNDNGLKLVYLMNDNIIANSYTINEMAYQWATLNISLSNKGYLDNSSINGIYINTFLATKANAYFKKNEKNI